VIGARFDAEVLSALGITAVFDELLGAELIDQRVTRASSTPFATAESARWPTNRS
jgi:hypothetical protein